MDTQGLAPNEASGKMITYQVEPYSQVIDEVRALLPSHYEEIATDKDVIPLDMHDESYREMEAKGELHVVTVRLDGKIVGYHCTIVRPHLHYRSTLCGFTDVYFLLPEYRRGRIGMGMFDHVEKTLKQRGVVKLFTGTKLHLDVSSLFERMGWTKTEHLFTKVISGRGAGDSSGGRSGC